MNESIQKAGVDLGATRDRITGTIKNDSWSVIAVMTGDEVPYAYTVGLHCKGLPELIIVGLDPGSAMLILSQCGERMISQGMAYPAGTKAEDFANLPIAVVDASDEFKAQYAYQAYNHYGHWSFGLQQLVILEACSKFPRIGDFDSPIRSMQPFLGDMPSQETVRVTVRATCHDSEETVVVTLTVNKSVIEDLYDCQDFVMALLPKSENKWVFWEADLLNEKGEKIGWTTSEI